METSLVIDNKDRKALDEKTFDRIHPISGDVVTTAAAAAQEDAIEAVDSAQAAFLTWSKTGPSERRAIMLKAADSLEAKMPDFISAMAQEVGASELWAAFNVVAAANLFREAAGLATQIQGETIPTDKPGTLSMTVRQPVGVILSIAPWNGPVALGARAIAYPLVCGNTVVFRASESSPKTHLLIAEALRDAGLPDGVLNVITNAAEDSPQIIDTLISHKSVRRINFTGSSRVGRIIAEKAARELKPVLLELGGKSPLVVLDDANIDDAVRAAVFGSFLYQGQICMSTERIVVDDSVADEFVQKFAARAAELGTGDPVTDGSCIVGPMLNAKNGPRLNGMMEDALSKGARVVAGGIADGAVMPATIIDHVTPEMQIYDEETFGPITTVVRAKGYDDAIGIANDTAYGLSAAVFGQDINRTLDAAMRIESGACHINGPTVQNEAQAPYGGVKDSGYGRFDGRAVINEFTELKWITVGRSDQQYPF
ncbi:aldehyde dehydrogenase [Pseudarthrobacter phenanthrenivorans]|uniref:Salicylaldehyde dehydrogenase n=2 Tax=Pseudarthrobacter phenanthrenivorans TaxID=361575 RepID=A0A3B0FI20_PSEPS|nr:aldehyde dehydrogenase [Pseudarthrobacter phenanthrenivorans]ADX75099.1 NAD-dependent aldehyde dehydrogenase [Pseudarthrobacter phenanthrenivorans Sphe3]RKO19520.1 aldehyde dehydrogenase [Pseudarthrobacter phenanthrenivorans]